MSLLPSTTALIPCSDSAPHFYTLQSLFTWPAAGSLPTEGEMRAYEAIYCHIYTTSDINFMSCFYWPISCFWSQFSKPVRGRCALMSLLNGHSFWSSRRAQPSSIHLITRARTPGVSCGASLPWSGKAFGAIQGKAVIGKEDGEGLEQTQEKGMELEE